MNTFMNNIIIGLNDSYKQSHFGFMEPNTTNIFSYIEARKGGQYTESMFFGLQHFLKKYLTARVTMQMVDEAETFLAAHGLPFNREGWEYIVNKLDGKIPLRIKAVKEGSVVPEGNVLVTVENTDENCAWITSFFETPLLRGVWYGTTAATRSYFIKKKIRHFMSLTSDLPDEACDYKMVDFAARGVSSTETAEIGGAGVLMSFKSTDNLRGIMAAQTYYNETDMLGFSIPASEHAVTTAYGIGREEQFVSDALDTFGGPGKLISLVADSYDYYEFLEMLGTKLKDKIIDNGATVVVRPDSGVPAVVVVDGLKALDRHFGHTVNSKGFKVLHPSVRMIQGDGIDHNVIDEIYEAMTQAGYSVENLTLGSGGFLLQKMDRDTLRFAMKASSVVIDGKERSVAKAPKTDMTKASKAGRLMLVKEDGEYKTVQEDASKVNELELVYEDGEMVKEWKFSEIRH